LKGNGKEKKREESGVEKESKRLNPNVDVESREGEGRPTPHSFVFLLFFLLSSFFFELAFQTQRQPEINQWKPEKLPRLQRLTF